MPLPQFVDVQLVDGQPAACLPVAGGDLVPAAAGEGERLIALAVLVAEITGDPEPFVTGGPADLGQVLGEVRRGLDRLQAVVLLLPGKADVLGNAEDEAGAGDVQPVQADRPLETGLPVLPADHGQDDTETGGPVRQQFQRVDGKPPLPRQEGLADEAGEVGHLVAQAGAAGQRALRRRPEPGLRLPGELPSRHK